MLSALRRGKSAHEALLEIWEEENAEEYGDNADIDFDRENENRSSNDSNSNPVDLINFDAILRRQELRNQNALSTSQTKQSNEYSRTEQTNRPNNESSLVAEQACPVCLEAFSELVKNGNELYSTTCGHIFCRNCITMAIKRSRKCPNCRRKLQSKEAHPIYLSMG